MKKLLLAYTLYAFWLLVFSLLFLSAILLAKTHHGSLFVFYKGTGASGLYVYDVDQQSLSPLKASGYEFNNYDVALSPDYQFVAGSHSSGTLSVFGLNRMQWQRHPNDAIDAAMLLGTLVFFWNNAVTYWGKGAWSPNIENGMMRLALSTNDAPDIDFHEWRYTNIWVVDVPTRRWQLSEVLSTEHSLIAPLGSDILDTRHRLTRENAYDGDMAWSPDGRQMAFVRVQDGNAGIYILDTDGINKNVRLITASNVMPTSPAWSPDGQWLVFAAGQINHYQLYIVSTKGGEPRQLTSDSFDNEKPSWSSDGKHIVYISDRYIALIKPDGSGKQRLFEGDSPIWVS